MKCNDIKELIINYSDGDLEMEDKRLVESHLAQCDECNLYLRQSDQVWEMLGGFEEIEPSGDFVARFWRKISEEEEQRSNGIFDFLKNWKLETALAGAMVVILVLSLVVSGLTDYNRRPVKLADLIQNDEQIFIELDKSTSRDTAESLEVYGPWYAKTNEDIKGG